VITDQKNLLVELGATPKVFTGNSRVVKQRGTYVVLKLVMYGTARESGEQETLKHLGSLDLESLSPIVVEGIIIKEGAEYE